MGIPLPEILKLAIDSYFVAMKFECISRIFRNGEHEPGGPIGLVDTSCGETNPQ